MAWSLLASCNGSGDKEGEDPLDPTFAVIEADIEYTYDAAADTWAEVTALQLEYSCPAADPGCTTTKVTLHFGRAETSGVPANILAATVAAVDAAGVETPLAPIPGHTTEDPLSGGQVVDREFTLRSPLLDGDLVALVIRVTEPTMYQQTKSRHSPRPWQVLEFIDGDGSAGCGTHPGWVAALPTVWVEQTAGEKALATGSMPIGSVRVVVSAGKEVLGLGPHLPCAAVDFPFVLSTIAPALAETCLGVDGFVSIDGQSSFLVGDYVKLADVLAPSGAVVSTWDEDPPCAATAVPAEWLATRLPADVAWLEDRFGDLPSSHVDLVLGRHPKPTKNAYLRGHTSEGLSTVSSAFWNAQPFQTHGYGENSFEPVAAHELAHQWWGVFRTVDSDHLTRWLLEAIPVLVQIQRYPEDGSHQNRLFDGLQRIVNRSYDGLDAQADLETPDLEPNSEWRREVLYKTAPYTLAQINLAARAIDPLRTEDRVWEIWQEELLVAGADHSPLTVPEVEAAIDVLGADLYQERVMKGRIGAPLLSVASPAGYASPGVEVSAAGLLTVRVRQVQHEGVESVAGPWPTFTHAPFVVGCRESGQDPAPTNANCIAAHQMDPKVYSAAHGATLPLTLLPSATPSDAIEVALFSEQRGLPGAVGRYAIEEGDTSPISAIAELAPATWLLRCAPGSVDPRCAVDTDLDGAPDEGDCAPYDALIHPEAVDPPAGGLPWDVNSEDLNCDYWPNSDFFTP